MSEFKVKNDVDIVLSGYECITFKEENEKFFGRGALHSNGKVVQMKTWAGSLIKLLDENIERSSLLLAEELSNTAGMFAMVMKDLDNYFLATDIIRSIPLFYGFRNNRLFITSNLHKFQEKHGHLEIDLSKLEEYIAFGFVAGRGTIYKEVYALQAGEIVSISKGVFRNIRYFEFKLDQKLLRQANLNMELKSFSQDLDKTFQSAFERMVEQSPEVNHWMVSLSGGHDSRIIVNYLHRIGLKNVVCYTYGTKGNPQSEISRQVAEALGFEWHFVEYTEQKWQDLHNSGKIDEFIDFAFNGVSIPHFQDFLAVHELVELGVVKEGDIFVSGHTLDWLVGSNFSNEDIGCVNKELAMDRVLALHTKIVSKEADPVQTLEGIFDESRIEPCYFQEYINWQEKRAKFMVNSMRGYDFFGFEFRLPFWDRELVDFCLKIPNEGRLRRNLFLNAELHGILSESLLSIPYYGKVDTSDSNPAVNLIKRFLPGFMKNMILKATGRKVTMNEGLNQIYALKAPTVGDIIEPMEDFPAQTRVYFKNFLERFPYQMDYHFLTALYTIRRQLDRDN